MFVCMVFSFCFCFHYVFGTKHIFCKTTPDLEEVCFVSSLARPFVQARYPGSLKGPRPPASCLPLS